MSRRITKTQEFREIKQMFDAMELEFNSIEEQLILGEADVKLNSIAFHFGKIYELYKAVVAKLEIYEPKRKPSDPKNLRPVVVPKS